MEPMVPNYLTFVQCSCWLWWWWCSLFCYMIVCSALAEMVHVYRGFEECYSLFRVVRDLFAQLRSTWNVPGDVAVQQLLTLHELNSLALMLSGRCRRTDCMRPMVSVARRLRRDVVIVATSCEKWNGNGREGKQEIWANAHETRHSISLISYAGCLGLSPVYFSENSL